MAIVDALMPEFDHEMAVTRKVLERVNDAQFAFVPPEGSSETRFIPYGTTGSSGR
jgi:hypothetical protein